MENAYGRPRFFSSDWELNAGPDGPKMGGSARYGRRAQTADRSHSLEVCPALGRRSFAENAAGRRVLKYIDANSDGSPDTYVHFYHNTSIGLHNRKSGREQRDSADGGQLMLGPRWVRRGSPKQVVETRVRTDREQTTNADVRHQFFWSPHYVD